MSQKPLVVYLHSVIDGAGVAGSPYTFMSVLNPSTSTKAMAALLFEVQTYAAGATSVAESLQVLRISAHSGGTLISPSNVNRFDTTHPDPACTVRVGNPTITTVGLPLRSWAPVISTGAGSSTLPATQPPGGASFICRPGEGLAFRVDDSDTDVRWDMVYVWLEAP